MIFFKKTWTFLADLSGVIQTLGLAVLGIGYLISWLSGNILFLTIFLLLFPFVIFSSFKWARISSVNFLQRITDIEINDETDKLETIKFNQDISKLLPNNSLINKLGDSLTKKAKDWTEDAFIVTFNLFLDVTSERNDLFAQAWCKSPWKNQEVFIYTGKKIKTLPNEVSPDHISPIRSVTFFYKKYPNWRKAVIKAYGAIKDILPNKFTLTICSHYDQVLHFRFKYNSGIDRTETFELSGNVLKDLKSGRQITI